MKELINNILISILIFGLLFILVACMYTPLYATVTALTGASFNNVTFLFFAIIYGVARLWEIIKP